MRNAQKLLLTRSLHLTGLLFCLSAAVSLQSQPLITNVVETGGDNEATDTITAKWTGITWNTTVANEPTLNTPVGTPFTVPSFGENVPCFVDRAHRYSAVSATLPIPSYLVGADYIMSGNDNRDNAGYQLDISVSDAALVYMLVDNRLFDGANGDPPNFAEGIDPIGWISAMTWLGTEGFQPVLNGLNRTADPTWPDEVGIDESSDGSINNWYSVYSKQVPAGTFSIYQADNSGRNMYGVVIKRLPNSINNPPEIKDLKPANNTLFYSAVSGLSFTATTVSPNNIPTANIKVTLNGTDVSSTLTIGGTSVSRTVSYAGLQPDTLYNASIIVSDQAGRSTTNVFTFDTFNEATAIAVEAEDYNYESGKFIAVPTPGSYAGLLGARNIDFHNNNGTTAGTVYRTGDFVGLGVTSDVARKAFTDAGQTDHQVTAVLAGDWWNYTRSFADGNYRIYLRGASTVAQRVRLDRIGGDATTANQTTSALGTFAMGPGTAAFTYAPLADAEGKIIVLHVSGNTTLRLTSLGASVNLQLNYLLVVPTTNAVSPAYLTDASPAPGAVNVPPDATVQFKLVNGSAAINEASIAVSFNGADVTAALTKTATADGILVAYAPPSLLELGKTQTVQAVFSETSGSPITNAWNFTTVSSLIRIRANYGTPVGSGQGSGFNFKIRKAPNYNAAGAAFTLANTAARANAQLADQLIDPDTTLPYVNEAPGPNNDGTGTTTLVNFDQYGAAAGFLGGDAAFPFVDTGITPDPNNIAMEFTTYLELSAGIHRFGVRSDDGFQLACGPTVTPADATLVLGQYEGGRGDGLPGGETTFEFLVETSGVYGIRMIYYEGNGDARVELYSIDRQTFTRTLINDSTTGAVKAFTSRSTQIYVPTVSITSPTNGTYLPIGPTNVIIVADAAVTGGQIAKVEFFDVASNKIGEATSAPYTVTWNNLSPGNYTIWARATDNKGLTKDSTKVNFKLAVLVQVNFQNPSSQGVEGYLTDIGEVFGDRGNGYSYGWDVDNTANARNRDNPISPDERYDTFNHMQKPLPAGRVWEIELPNGRYNVFAVVGEPNNADSVYDLTAENVTIVKGTPSASVLWFEGMAAVTVADGRLSLGNGPTASNNKVDFVEIYQLPAVAPTPVLNAPILNGSTITITWTGGRLQEAPEVTGQWTDVPGNPQGTYSVSITAAPRKFYRVAQ